MTSALSIKHDKRGAVAAGLLAALAFLCFIPSLFAGFISDDGSQYVYISNYLRTQPLLLLQNFASCWMQEPLWGLHYRPMMLLPLVFDVLAWNQNTIGWHITCLSIHAACTVLLFFIARKLLKNLAGLDGIAIPFLAGALFATHPLHSESVVWICGRVDSVCTLFYLSSFLTFLQSLEIGSPRAKTLRIVSLCLCMASLLTKELGATLPGVFAWYAFCAQLKQVPWKQAIFSALKATRIYWLLLVVYLIARSISLGTLYGGYRGFGSVVLDAIWLPGLLNWKLLRGVFFPISLPQLDELDIAMKALIGLNATMGLACLVRFFMVRDWGIWRAALFLFGWLTIAFSLVARVWYAAGGLPGGRHFYLVSVPLCILSILLIVPSTTKNVAQKKLQKFAIGVVSIYCFLLAALSLKSTELWIATNKYETAIESGISDLAKKSPQASRLLFLNVPTTFHHLPLYPTFINLQGCLKQPKFSPDLANKIASLRAHIFNLDLVNKSALAANLAQGANTVVFGWDADKLATSVVPSDYFSSATLQNSVEPKDVRLKIDSKELGVITYSFPPAPEFKKGLVDCLEVTASSVLPAEGARINPLMLLSWNQDASSHNHGLLTMYKTPEGARSCWRYDETDGLARSVSCYLEADGKPHKYRFHLSEFSGWILFGKLSEMRLTVAPAATEILSVRFLNLDNEIPKLDAPLTHWTREQNGTLAPKAKDALVLNFDATKIAGANHVMAEISKPFEYFDYFNASYRQDALSPNSLKKYSLQGLKGEMTLWREDFKVEGEYDVRIAAFDKDGKLLGYVSDPVTIDL